MRVSVVPEGILVQSSASGQLSLLVTRVIDLSQTPPSGDGGTGSGDGGTTGGETNPPPAGDGGTGPGDGGTTGDETNPPPSDDGGTGPGDGGTTGDETNPPPPGSDNPLQVRANRDGVISYEDIETIIASADLLANDTLGGLPSSDLTIIGLTNFRHGTGFLDVNGFVHFQPEADYFGSDAGFDYIVRAGNGQVGTATVELTLQNINDAPTLDRVDHVTRPVYGYTPLRFDQEGYFAGGGQPIYQPYAIEYTSGEGERPSMTIVYDPEPNYWNYDYHLTPIAYEDTGAGATVGADIDDPAGALRYEIVSQPQYGAVTLNADGTFQYTSWKEPGVASDRIVVNGEYAGTKYGELYTASNLPSNAVYPTEDVFQIRITDPHGATTIQSVSVPHYGPYLPPTPPGGGGKKPIAIDLNGNGFEFVNVDDSNVFFDVNGDGWKERTAWVAPDDGLLAYDIDGDGKIDQAGEISFTRYKQGAQTDLEALAAFDTNHDGLFSAADEAWARFGVWRDENQNGVTDPGEFRTLEQMGVASIALTSDGGFRIINGQTVHGVGAMTLSDGSTLAMADVTLAYSNKVQLKLPDGTTRVMDRLPFSPSGEVLEGTSGEDLILGKNGNNIVYAYAGDDVVFEDGGNDIIDGGAGNDLIYSGADNDLVFGGTGDDTIFTGLGNDVVFGGDGHDAIFAEGGNDVVFGGAGNDLISGGWGNDVLSGDDGNDQIYGESGNDALFGRDGDDELSGGEGDDRLDGGAGNDLLDGGTGADVMIGGMGDDLYVVDNAADIVTEFAGEGVDTVHASISYTLADALENLTLTGTADLNGTGNAADNRLVGNAGANTLRGEAGNDWLDGGIGADRLIGGTGDDTYVVDNIGDTVVENAGEGHDTVRASISYALTDNVEDLVLTGSQSLSGTGNALDNTLTGNLGDNVLDGGSGADTMRGGRGNDSYVVDNPGDVVIEQAGEGVDTIYSSVNYALPANVENLVLTGAADINGTGNALDNSIIGNGGANRVDGGLGADAMAGGAGDDTYIVDNAGDTVTELPGDGIDQVYSSVSHALSANVEHLTLTGTANIDGTGNDLDNILIGNAGDNVLDGSTGADRMTGGAGDDSYIVDNAGDTVAELPGEGTDIVYSSISYVLPEHVENLMLIGAGHINGTGNALDNILIGNSGANRIDGGLGADSMAGGAGDDIYIVDNAGDTVTELPGDGTDIIYASVSYVLPEHVENMTLTGAGHINGTGNVLDNILIGNSGNNVLVGLDGNDRLMGLSGNDILLGGAGDDTLFGGTGNDVVAGGEGNDTFLYNLGDGLDTLSDTAGIDSVQFGTGIGFDRVAIRVTEQNGIKTAHLRILNAGGCEMPDQGMDFVLDANNASPIESFRFVDGSVYTMEDLLIQTRYFYGTPKTDVIRAGRHDDIIYAGPAANTVYAGSGNDIVYGEQRDDALYGEGGDDFLSGGEGDDTLDGGCGTDVLSGGNGDDVLRDPGGGNAALLGGHGRDTITGGAGNDFIAGGKHDDVLDGGMGCNVFAFSKENGRDVILPALGASNTLSLGSVDYGDLRFRKSGTDLVLENDADSSITFKGWYADAANQNFTTLQVIAGQDKNHKQHGGDDLPFTAAVETFDFQRLVTKFDQARAANAKLSSWSVMNGLLEAHLASSDSTALGGDLAFYYGQEGDLKGMALLSAQSVLKDPNFGAQAQAIHPWSSLESGAVKVA